MIRKASLLLAVVLAFLNWQCNGTKKIQADESDTYLILEKGGCLNNCKTFTLKIQQDGLAEYSGKANVTKIGQYTRKLSDPENSGLWEFIEKNDIFEWSGYLGSVGEDSQQRKLVLCRKKEVKSLTYGAMAPKPLMDLEHKIETLAETGEWKKR